MSKRKKVFGTCKICGAYGQLTYEHVPPKAAYNNGQNYYQATLEDVVKLESVELDLANYSKFPLQNFTKMQGGIGYFSLCGKCNNDTGRWYARDFVIWAQQAMYILLKTNGKPTLHYPTYFFPLRVIKQVITMFFSMCHDFMREEHPDLVAFVLNREKRFLDEKYKVYCYYNLNGSFRYNANNFIGHLSANDITHASELSFPPFGFVFTLNSKKPDNRLMDISYFANFEYNKWLDYYQKFNVLPTFLPYAPLDYRTKDEVISAIMSSRIEQYKNSFKAKIK